MGGLADLTDDESSAVDFWMSEHMHRHQNSNNIGGMACDTDCRTQALAEGFRRHVLLPRRAHLDGLLTEAREDVARAIYEDFYPAGIGWDHVDHKAWARPAAAAEKVYRARLGVEGAGDE